jgi:hypothetical protein
VPVRVSERVEGVVMSGRVAAMMTVKVLERVKLRASVTWAVKVKEPAALGVPVS